MRRELERIDGDRAARVAQIARARASIGEAELEIVRAEKRFREEVIGELRDVEGSLLQLSEERDTLEERLRRRVSRAPESGRVLDLRAHTVGGVVTAGEAILEIVPLGDRLVVAAEIRPEDVDKVRVGSEARVRLSAFDQRMTPEVKGRVGVLSADRLVDGATGRPYYLATLVPFRFVGSGSSGSFSQTSEKEHFVEQPSEVRARRGNPSEARETGDELIADVVDRARAAEHHRGLVAGRFDCEVWRRSDDGRLIVHVRLEEGLDDQVFTSRNVDLGIRVDRGGLSARRGARRSFGGLGHAQRNEAEALVGYRAQVHRLTSLPLSVLRRSVAPGIGVATTAANSLGPAAIEVFAHHSGTERSLQNPSFSGTS